MTAYYNEVDRFAAAWLRELMSDGLIPIGDVDERNIIDVKADDLDGYSQCHFFSGIGGWAYALELAGWAGPVWTGSCPCQPFSNAGQQRGHADERHLWPAFYALIAECRPSVVFGEQVASPLGREWLAGVRADLETMGYAVGAADLPAAGVGAPHIRQRLWWVADADGGLGDAFSTGLEGHAGDGCHWNQPGRLDTDAGGSATASGGAGWLPCADGKARRAEPGIFPLVDGFPNRVGTLRGAGNAIVPALAAEFVRAFLEAR